MSCHNLVKMIFSNYLPIENGYIEVINKEKTLIDSDSLDTIAYSIKDGVVAFIREWIYISPGAGKPFVIEMRDVVQMSLTPYIVKEEKE